MSTTEAKRTNNDEIEDLDVIVVGAGFAGLYLLVLDHPGALPQSDRRARPAFAGCAEGDERNL